VSRDYDRIMEIPPPSKTRGSWKVSKYWRQRARHCGVKLKLAIGSPTMPSVPHWQTIAAALNLSLTA